MATIRSFEDIRSWQLARELTREIYQLSNSGAFSRDFALRDQMRRAVLSVMANIAEGFDRSGSREFVQFLSIAKGSAAETRSFLYVAYDLGYISEVEFNDLVAKCVAIATKIQNLIDYLRKTDRTGTKFVNVPKTNGQKQPVA